MVRDIRSDSEQRFSTKGNADMHKSKENYGESAIKSDQDYLIGAEIVIETDCLLILGMMRCCTIPDVAMLRWIAYVKSLNQDVRHISEKDNAVADMLSRARCRVSSRLRVKRAGPRGSWTREKERERERDQACLD